MITPSGISVADYIAASLADGTRSHIRITAPGGSIALDDEDVESSGLQITSALNTSTNLTIGGAVSQQVSIPLLNTDRLWGIIWTAEFQVEYGIEVGNDTYWITLGYFSGVKPESYIGDAIINFVAYDRMQKFDVIADEWLDSLTYPMTTLQMFKSLCTYCGVGWRAGDELPNIKNRTFTSAPVQQRGLTCRTILSAIAEACGCYAKIDNEGYCKMVWFANHASDFVLTGDEEFGVKVIANSIGKTWEGLESYRWIDLEGQTWADLEGMQNQFRIDGIKVTQTEDDVGVLYPDGMTGNIYQIVDNPFLVTSSEQDILDYIVPIYTRLNNIGGYVPVSVSSIGCAIIEGGDIITVSAGDETVHMPIFVKNSVWNGSLLDSLETTGDLVRETVSSDVSQKLSEGGRYHKWKNTIDELYSELYDPTTGDVSVLQQTASALGMTAEGIDLQGNKYVNITGGELNITSGGNLRITSGGTMDVDTSNFKINSVDNIVQCGETELSNKGIVFNESIYGNCTFIGDKFIEAGDTGFEDVDFVKGISTNSGVKLYESRIVSPGGSVYTCGLKLEFTPSLGHVFLDSWLYIDNANAPSKLILGYFTKVEEGHFKNVYYESLVQDSSRNVKHNIKPLLPCGEKLDGLEPVTFVYDNDIEEKEHTGLIYEDTVDIMPEICTKNEAHKAINYVELIPMLLKEIKELRARVKALEERRN